MTKTLIQVWSEEAEQSVIGAILQDNQSIEQVGDLKASDFYAGRHKAIFAAITGLLSAGKGADVVTVADKMKEAGTLDEVGGYVYLNELQLCVPSASRASLYAGIVAGKSAIRTVIAAADQAKEIATGEGDAGGMIDQITSIFGALIRNQYKKAPERFYELAIARTAHYEALERGETVTGWRTHIQTLTHRLSGGLRPGGFYVVAARPGVGKSSFSAELAINLSADGLPSLFLSQEMNNTELVDRGLANQARVSYSRILLGRLDEQDWRRTSEAVEGISNLPFYIDDQPALTLRDIRSKAKQITGLKVLIIDYLQLTASNLQSENRNSQIEEISRGLKALAKEMQIAVIALSQLNREVDKRSNKRPALSDLRDSGAIEQDADVVIFLWPVREYEHEGRKVIGCDIAKNRQGRTGEFGLDFYGDHQRWAESADDIRPTTNRGGDL